MSAWDINNIRKLAGLPPAEAQPLTESWNDDDDSDFGDDDPDARIADEDDDQKHFEKKNKKEIKAADKESKELVKKKPAAEKKEPAKAEPKKEAEPAKDAKTKYHEKKAAKQKETEAVWATATKKSEPKKDDSKEEPKKDDSKEEPKKDDGIWGGLAKGGKEEKKPAEPKKDDAGDSTDAKKRGRAHNPDSKQGKGREWLQANPGATRGQFISHMVTNHGMSKHHANTHFYAHKKASGAKQDVKEAFFIQHPFISSYILHENRELNKYDWVDHTSDKEPLVFLDEAEAKKMIKYMAEWKGQPTKLLTVPLDEGYNFDSLDDAADCHMDAHVNGDKEMVARAEGEISKRFGEGSLTHVRARSKAFAGRSAKNDVGPESKAEAAEHLERARTAIQQHGVK